MMKRLTALIMTLCLLLCTPTALAAIENLTELPLTTEPVSFHIVGAQSAYHSDWNEMESLIELQKRTGIELTFEMIPNTMLAEKRNLMLASNDLPDAFFGCKFTASDLISYAQDDLIIPLDSYIESCMPNLSAVLNDPEYAAVLPGITFPDGHIYTLPHLYQADYWAMVGQEHLFINTEWLERLNLAMPTTPAELFDVLMAFKEQDADGDGDPNNEIPIGGKSNVIVRLLASINGSWGLQNMGNSHLYVDRDPAGDGTQLRFFKTDDRFREVLEYLNSLYVNGLMEQEAFTIETSQIVAKASTGVYGVLNCLSPMGDYSLDYGVYEGLDILTGPHGDQLHSAVNSQIARIGDFVVTSACENVELLLKMYDYYCYSRDGLILLYLGQEGKQWEYDAAGERQYMEWITNNPDGLTLDQAVGTFTYWPDGSVSSFSEKTTSRSIRTKQDAFESCEIIHDKYVKAVPPFTYTLDESEQLNSQLADLITYVDSMVNKFIKGDAGFDQWDTYVKTCEKMGLDDYLAIQQAAFDRFNSNLA